MCSSPWFAVCLGSTCASPPLWGKECRKAHRRQPPGQTLAWRPSCPPASLCYRLHLHCSNNSEEGAELLETDSIWCGLVKVRQEFHIILAYLGDLHVPAILVLQYSGGFSQSFLALFHIEELVFHLIDSFMAGLCRSFFLAMLVNTKDQKDHVFLTVILEFCSRSGVMRAPSPSLQVRDLLAYHCNGCTLKSCTVHWVKTAVTHMEIPGVKRKAVLLPSRIAHLPCCGDAGKRFHSRALRRQAAYCLSSAVTAKGWRVFLIFIWPAKDAATR